MTTHHDVPTLRTHEGLILTLSEHACVRWRQRVGPMALIETLGWHLTRVQLKERERSRARTVHGAVHEYAACDMGAGRWLIAVFSAKAGRVIAVATTQRKTIKRRVQGPLPERVLLDAVPSYWLDAQGYGELRYARPVSDVSCGRAVVSLDEGPNTQLYLVHKREPRIIAGPVEWRAASVRANAALWCEQLGLNTSDVDALGAAWRPLRNAMIEGLVRAHDLRDALRDGQVRQLTYTPTDVVLTGGRTDCGRYTWEGYREDGTRLWGASDGVLAATLGEVRSPDDDNS